MVKVCALVCHKLNRTLKTFRYWMDVWGGTEEQILSLLEEDGVFNLSFKKSDFCLKSFEKSISNFEKKGIQFIHYDHKYYPDLLKEIHDPPFVLFAKGNLELLLKKTISMVGSREILPWVGSWMRQELPIFHRACPNIVVVSGGARGVDQYAHNLAASHGPGTIVVLPSGVLNPYPKDVKPALEKYGKDKVLWISDYWPELGMRKFHFHKRNRIISGLSKELFVAQAGRRSGSMITARLAIENNRSIQCLPMTPFDFQGFGNLNLLFEGAGLVRYAQDLISLGSSFQN